MLGRLDPADKKVTIVGAGIAGLVAAYVLDRRGFEVTLYEAAPRCGGMIETRKTPKGSIESAAHSFLATPAVRGLCEELGVPLCEVRSRSKARFILRNGRMRRLPLTFLEALRAFLRAYFVRSLDRFPIRTLEDWARRFLGEGSLQYLIVPFVRGIYGAEPSETDLEAAFPSLAIPRGHSLLSYRLARLFRPGLSKKRPSGPMAAPADGMGNLVEKIETALSERLGSRLKRNIQITELPQARNLILAVPAHAAARLLMPVDPDLGKALAAISYAPLISASIFAPVSGFRKPPRGVGVLIPKIENRKCLGILFNSSSFPGRSMDEYKTLSLTMMLGGTSQPELLGLNDGDLAKLIVSELCEILGYSGPAPEIVIQRQEQAIPRYNEQLKSAWRVAEESWCKNPGHVLFGNYTGQVSIRGMIETALEKLA